MYIAFLVLAFVALSQKSISQSTCQFRSPDYYCLITPSRFVTTLTSGNLVPSVIRHAADTWLLHNNPCMLLKTSVPEHRAQNPICPSTKAGLPAAVRLMYQAASQPLCSRDHHPIREVNFRCGTRSSSRSCLTLALRRRLGLDLICR